MSSDGCDWKVENNFHFNMLAFAQCRYLTDCPNLVTTLAFTKELNFVPCHLCPTSEVLLERD